MMDRSGASAYIYAKASGMLSKSYVGERTQKLFSVHSLTELWNLLFTEEVPAIPEMLLAKRLEEKASEQFLSDYITLLDAYTKPDDVLVALLHVYDYDNLKVMAATAAAKVEKPFIKNLKHYAYLKYDEWPNIAKLTEGSPLSWYNKVPDFSEQQSLDMRLDTQYIHELWQGVQNLPSKERKPVQDLIASLYSLRNVIWVMRLKVFYKMPKDEILNHIVYIDKTAGTKDILAKEAISVLDKSIDSWDDWSNWKYARYLNPNEDGTVWNLDPGWFENCFYKDFYKKVYKEFHHYPFTSMVLVSWFHVKLNELNCIRTAAEAIRLNIDVAHSNTAGYKEGV